MPGHAYERPAVEWPTRINQHMRSVSPMRLAAAIGVLCAVGVAAAGFFPRWGQAALAVGMGVLAYVAVRVPGRPADQALRESEHKFRNFVEQSLVGIYVVQDGKLVYANHRTAELLGYDNTEAL